MAELPPVIIRRKPCVCGAPVEDHCEYVLVMGGKEVASLEVDYYTFMTLWMAHDQRTLLAEGFDD